MDAAITGGIITAIPAIVVPMVSFLLERNGIAARIRETKLFEKRVQLIERLLANGSAVGVDERKQLEDELRHVVQQVLERQADSRSAVKSNVDTMDWWQRWLLLYEQPNSKASVFRF